jgi:hypothetical protein
MRNLGKLGLQRSPASTLRSPLLGPDHPLSMRNLLAEACVTRSYFSRQLLRMAEMGGSVDGGADIGADAERLINA